MELIGVWGHPEFDAKKGSNPARNVLKAEGGCRNRYRDSPCFVNIDIPL